MSMWAIVSQQFGKGADTRFTLRNCFMMRRYIVP